MDVAFSHNIRDHILIITLQEAKLDAMNASAFKDKILELIHNMQIFKIILDLSHVQFIDSSGLGAFLTIQRALHKQGGALKLVQLNKHIQTIFEIVSMHRILDVFPGIEEAVKTF